MDLKHWKLELDADNLAWLWFDRAGSATNTFSTEALEELGRIADHLAGMPPRGLAILSAKENGFAAGADIDEFTTISSAEQAMAFTTLGNVVFDKIAALPFPTLAMIHGFCMGGGTELALACRYRTADDGRKTKMALPEVLIGIVPGWGWRNPISTADAERRFGEYSCQDSAVSAECMAKLDQELDEQGYRKTYEMTLDLYQPLLAMMLRGFLVNKPALEKAREQITQERDKVQEELNQVCGCELNVGSPKQCAEYFYVKKGIKPYVSRKTGSVTTDDKALARLARGTKARPGLPEARLAQRVRAYNKLLSTYYSIQLDDDGRFRSSYNPRGTTTGRLSSSETIFGTGGNAQNIPPEFPQFLVADPGYILIEVDKVQAEWVVTAYLAQDPRMINIVENNLDAHIETAKYVTGIPEELIRADDKLIGKETNTDIITELREAIPELKNYRKVPRSMSIRQGYKRANYGLNYGMGVDKFALTNDLEREEASEMHEGYHNAYPNLRSIYYVYVQHCLSKDRTLVNCFGRPRRFLGPWGPELFNQAYDFIPQSTVVDLVDQGIVGIYRDKSDYLRGLEILAHGHDSLTFQFPTARISDLRSVLDQILCVAKSSTRVFWSHLLHPKRR